MLSIAIDGAGRLCAMLLNITMLPALRSWICLLDRVCLCVFFPQKALFESDFFNFPDFRGSQALLTHGAKLEVQTHKGFTPLLIAAYHARGKCVLSLLDCKANPWAVTTTGNSAILFAASEREDILLRVLIANVSSSPQAREATFVQSLPTRQETEHISVARDPQDSGSTAAERFVNLPNLHGWTPLMAAAQNGHEVSFQAYCYNSLAHLPLN